jgi:hypothetical protein
VHQDERNERHRDDEVEEDHDPEQHSAAEDSNG